METKAFSMQSPEAIAKQYGGNKQKIAQAMQLGIIDPTAGTLAGMFIDRMRAAAQAEQAPQQTVAQQVFAPPAPPQQQMPPQAPPQAGLGATPPAGQAPPMGMAAGGMVAFADGGGLPSLQVPDDMFNSSLGNSGDDQQYADGGVVSFAAGSPGSPDPLAWMKSKVTSPYGQRGADMHEGVDFGVGSGTPIGVPVGGTVVVAKKDDINGNYVIVQHPDGSRSSYSHLSKFNVKPGDPVNAGDILGLSGASGRVRSSTGGDGSHLHFGVRDAERNRIDPAGFLKNPSAAGIAKANAAPAAVGTRVPTLANYVEPDLSQQFEPEAIKGMAFMDKYAPQTRKAADKLMEEADRMSNPETVKKQERDDKWMALAEFGFKLAGSNSPYFLQAVGEAANATLPGMKADKKEREARRLDAIKMYAQAEGITNEMATRRATAGIDYAKNSLGIKESSLGRVADLAKAAANDATQIQVANIQVAGNLAVEKERTAATISASEKLTAAEKLKLNAVLAGIPLEATKAIDNRLASDKGYMDLKGKPMEQAAYRAKLIAIEEARMVAAVNGLIGPTSGTPPPAAARTPKEGETSVATDGRKIMFRNGRWEFIEKKS